MDNKSGTKAAREFATMFADALSASIALAIRSPWPLEVAAYADPSVGHSRPIHFRLKLDGSLCGECYIEFCESQISYLAEKMQSEAAEMTAEERADVLAAALSAAAPGLTTSLSAVYGATTVKIDGVTGLAFGGMFVVPLSASADSTGATTLLYFDTRLLDSLKKSEQSKQPGGSQDLQIIPDNLKIVMDVELNVSLLFGRRRLPLRDVLDLSSGSVIELDRMVDEPVELLLDGKVIARGDAVIVDGNYGLRVTEITQSVASHFLS